jgi:uncharacterized protein (TIGR03435 family)
MHARAFALTFFVVVTCGARASERLRFDVASVKPAPPGARISFQGGPGSADPGRASYTKATLIDLMTDAFHVQPGQISGPAWLTSKYFAVTATMPPATTHAEFSQMMETLLIERFHLVVHRETKEDSGYELLVDKKGPKVTRSVLSAEGLSSEAEQAPGCAPDHTLRAELVGTRWKITVTNCSMGAFAGYLSGLLGEPFLGGPAYRPGQRPLNTIFVVNKTDLSGKYSFQFEFDPELSGLQVALQSKIGMRLVESKVAREHTVIDHIDEMPTED